MYRLTHKNIRLRYLAAKDDARLEREAGNRKAKFSFETMGDLFMISGQECYNWTRDGDRLPTGKRAKAVLDWLNDGRLTAFLERIKIGSKWT